MRKVHIQQVKVDSVLAENIYNPNGVCLLAKGTKLNKKLIERLQSTGLPSVCIEDKIFEGLNIEYQETLKEETKIKALSTTKTILDNFTKSKTLENIEDMQDVIEEMLSQIISNNIISVNIADIQSYDTGTYAHSLSVTILCLYLAKNMGLSKHQLKEIAIGGILHDIGKLNIPSEILNKPGKLSNEEFNIIKKHPMDGFKVIRDKIPLLSAHIALQHHEKFNGSGYPRGIKGDEIHLYGRISAIADVYEAVTADRPYREGLKPHKAIELLINGSGEHFDPEILKEFLQVVAPFPNGTIVELNDKSKAIVIKQNKGYPLRPKLLVFQKDNILLKEFINLDLFYQIDINIIKVSDNV